ncbi:TadE/TadG family type IV pilus assembly protein [Desulfolutivibrio sulfodismutans]|uniref:TadE/TadG family type IV pilus assembly protein n=1 Tax=Desulfolutivibrio sulfodismutans TaxID=63561 RepID=UPI001FE59CF4|nr:TadE/TadG family type IV pilus assembly protein [Desulfolutivibrio sulfodismutans]
MAGGIARLRPARSCRCPRDHSRRGAITPLLAIALPAIIGAAGLAVDGGRMYLADRALQNAVDAAALAGSMALPEDPDMDQGIAAAAAQEMLSANYPEATMVSAGPGSEVRSACVVGQANVDYLLMGVLGLSSGQVTAKACAGFNNLEIVLVLDTTGSMKGTPIANVKSAATDLVELILPSNTTPSTKIGMVPFRGMVRLRAGVDGVAAGCRNANGTFNNGKLLDVYKAAKYRYPTGSSLNVDSDTCSNISYVEALTTDRASILSRISALSADGAGSGTIISEGIKWGSHVLTPASPFTEGSSDEKYRKIMIVLTDGDTEDGRCGGTYGISYTPNNYWTNSYFGMGLSTTYPAPANFPDCKDGGGLNTAMANEAAAAKALGIEIFSIRFGVSDATDVSLMKQIASSKEGTLDHYFDAPSATDILKVFKLIGRQLGHRLIPYDEAMGTSS